MTRHLFTCTLAAALLATTGCATTPEPRAAASEQMQMPSFEVTAHQDVSMFLFSFHAARSLSTQRLRSRVPLTAEDAAALAANAEDFAPLYTAWEPSLEAHPLRTAPMLVAVAALAGDDQEFPSPELMAALDDFRPHYEEHFAPAHRALTHSYVEALEEQLAQHGDAMAIAVARQLESGWRVEPYRIEIAPYATITGAYTISLRTVISATDPDYRPHMLEMAFHEAAHTSPIGDNLRNAADAALAAHGLEENRFWHYLLFYAVGRATQEVLGDDYVPYYIGAELAEQSGSDWYAALETVWDDHDTLAARAEAAAAIIASQSA